MRLGRVIAVVLALVLAAAACNRVVDLTPTPDATHDDAAAHGDGFGFEGFAPDAGDDGGGIQDGGTVPDAFTAD